MSEAWGALMEQREKYFSKTDSLHTKIVGRYNKKNSLVRMRKFWGQTEKPFNR